MVAPPFLASIRNQNMKRGTTNSTGTPTNSLGFKHTTGTYTGQSLPPPPAANPEKDVHQPLGPTPPKRSPNLKKNLWDHSRHRRKRWGFRAILHRPLKTVLFQGAWSIHHSVRWRSRRGDDGRQDAVETAAGKFNERSQADVRHRRPALRRRSSRRGHRLGWAVWPGLPIGVRLGLP